MTDLLEILRKKSQFKRKLANSLGIGLVGAIFIFPTYFFAKQDIADSKDYREQKIAEKILASGTNQSRVDELLIPYLKNNLRIIDNLPEDYETLQTLQMIVNKKRPITTNTSVNLERKLIRANEYRISIDGKPYFSENSLSSNLEFVASLNQVLDKSNRILYTPSEDQRLTKPIRDISEVITLPNEVYIAQASTLFKYENNQLISTGVELKKSTENIHGTPLFVAFTEDGPMLLGETEKQRTEKINENLITRLKEVQEVGHDSSYFQLRVSNENLYFNDGSRFKILPLDTNAVPFNVDYTGGKDPIIMDYIPLSTSKPTDIKVAFYEKTLGGRNPSYCFVTRELKQVGSNSVSIIRRIPTSTLGEEYRFPKNADESDLLWLDPANLKEKIKNQLKKQKNSSGAMEFI